MPEQENPGRPAHVDWTLSPPPHGADGRRDELSPYDLVVLLSFGGPEHADEVMPFLRRVTRGRGVPDERLAAVAEHYHAHGGRSPINDQCRDLVAALRSELDRRGLTTEVTWGARNSAPYISDVLADAAARGHRRVVVLTTSAYPSYSSCRQYREDLAGARPDGMRIDRIRQYALSDGFLAANTDAVERALHTLPRPDWARVLFVTHSIPTAMAEAAGPASRPAGGSYVVWHQQVADRVLAELRSRLTPDAGVDDDRLVGELVYCSRSGPPTQPWLEPDVNDRLRELGAREPDRPVVLAPIGFVSDHMEVINDLDVEAMASATEAGLRCVRAATAGTDPRFVAQLVDGLLDRAGQARAEDAVGPPAAGPTAGQAASGPGWTPCPTECCVNLRRPGTPAIP